MSQRLRKPSNSSQCNLLIIHAKHYLLTPIIGSASSGVFRVGQRLRTPVALPEGPEFTSQKPCGCSQLSVAPGLGDLMPSSDLFGHCMHLVYKHAAGGRPSQLRTPPAQSKPRQLGNPSTAPPSTRPWESATRRETEG